MWHQKHLSDDLQGAEHLISKVIQQSTRLYLLESRTTGKNHHLGDSSTRWVRGGTGNLNLSTLTRHANTRDVSGFAISGTTSKCSRTSRSPGRGGGGNQCMQGLIPDRWICFDSGNGTRKFFKRAYPWKDKIMSKFTTLWFLNNMILAYPALIPIIYYYYYCSPYHIISVPLSFNPHEGCNIRLSCKHRELGTYIHPHYSLRMFVRPLWKILIYFKLILVKDINSTSIINMVIPDGHLPLSVTQG